ncbi:MAG: response regulator transcription factor [Lachnospiraceae bacterium]|nr:response regulator transcription factor [Lachnospiraceae bacterium]
MKILLIEDDSNLALGLKYSLKEEGFEVIHAENLNNGKENFQNQTSDLILLDIMLPDGNGYEFCKWVRERDKDIPIIFLTAIENEESVVKGFGLGADDYVIKPFRVNELVARIRAHYKRVENSKDKLNSEISDSYKDFKLDHTRLCIWNKDKRIDLTPAEYKILRKLIEFSGEIVSREALTECLWENAGEYLDANTLSVHIKRIREKLGEGENSELIQTIRGEGYKFIG